MKKIPGTILVLLFVNICFAQTNFSFNQGSAYQTNYFSTIPYESINDKIILKVTIKEKQYRFILDTGAPTIISSRLFKELNPEIIAKTSISDANAAEDSLSIVSLHDIVIGDILFTNIPALVSNQNQILECFQVDGFIGSNLLRNSIVQFNSTTKNVILTNDQTKLMLNQKQSSELFLDKQSGPFIWVQLKGRKKAKEQLLFDTGMNGLYDLSLNHHSIFQDRKIFETISKAKGSNSIGFHGVAKDSIHYRLRLPSMEVNGATLKNISTQTTSGNNSRIGGKLLEYGIVTIDYTNKRFYFAPFFKTEKDVGERHFPLDPVPCDNQLCIGFVWDTELAGKITTGDQIIAIDNVSYESINLCDLLTTESPFKNKNNLTMTVKNHLGEKIEITLERE